MTDPAKARRIGLLSLPMDPVAQLYAETCRAAGHRVVGIHGPEAADGLVDAIVVTSHRMFVADAAWLCDQPHPCDVILRGRSQLEGRDAWLGGIRLCAAIAGQSGAGNIRLRALSAQSAAALADETGLVVTPLEPRVADQTKARRRATIDTESGVIRVAPQPGGAARPDDPPEDRTLPLHALNWSRLADRVTIDAPDPPDADLAGIVAYANAGRAAARDAGGERAIVIVVPNGVGLGHLTRMLAVAHEIGRLWAGPVVFWCFSRGAELIEAAGHAVVHRQTAEHLGCESAAWRRWETLAFARFLQSANAAAVVYDGSAPDRFMAAALREPGNGGIGFVWVRRGMWNEKADCAPLEDTHLFDCILEPGELAAEADKGVIDGYTPEHLGLAEFVAAPPVTLLSRDDMPARRAARRDLKIGRGATCMVSLGSDVFGGHDLLISTLIAAARHERVRLVWLRSPLAPMPGPDRPGMEVRQVYPVSRYFNAFDGVVSAAGYNSFHELMLLYDGPVLFAPAENRLLDDQAARAAYAEEQGWAASIRSADPATVQFEKLAAFMRSVRRGEGPANRPRVANGAAAIAARIVDVARRSEPDGGAR